MVWPPTARRSSIPCCATSCASLTNFTGTAVCAGRSGGTFETEANAFYLEDIWNITPNLMLNLGVRWDRFENRTADGDAFIKMDDLIAPRVGFAWDIKGDGSTKLFGNAGRYYLPVTNNIILKKLRVAFELKEDDLHAILKAADFVVSKPELSALFRARDHKHYQDCGDQILRNFLIGLTAKYRPGP